MNIRSLFGVSSSEIQPLCIIAPFIYTGMLKDLGSDPLRKGERFSSGKAKNFTLIHTGIGPTQAGDAVLHLKDTPCERIILYGACGLTARSDGLDIGSVLTISKAFNFESFSRQGPDKSLHPSCIRADTDLTEKLSLKTGSGKYSCATFGSVQLEVKFQDIFNSENIKAVDMECSAVFSSAELIERKVSAVMYATDIVGEGNVQEMDKHILLEKTAEARTNISRALRSLT